MRWNNKYNVSLLRSANKRFKGLQNVKRIKNQKIRDPLLEEKRRTFFAYRKKLSEEYYSYDDNRGMLKRLRLEKDKHKRTLNTKVYYGTNIIYNKSEIITDIKGSNVKPSRKDCDAVPYIGHSNRSYKKTRLMFHDKKFDSKR